MIKTKMVLIITASSILCGCENMSLGQKGAVAGSVRKALMPRERLRPIRRSSINR